MQPNNSMSSPRGMADWLDYSVLAKTPPHSPGQQVGDLVDSPAARTPPSGGRLSRRAADLSERKRRRQRLEGMLATKKFSPRSGAGRLAATISQASGEQLAEGVPPSSHRPFVSQSNSDTTIAGILSPSRVRMGPQEFVAWLERDRSSSGCNLDEEADAIAVQRHARGLSGRRAHATRQTECDAARTIQSAYRYRYSRQQRTRAANLHESEMAARTIQARYRSGRTRRQLKRHQQACETSALDIQRHWRGRQARQEAERAHPLYGLPPWAGDAATSIQSRWRGGKSRETLLPAMEHHRRTRNDAAAVVQARYRSSAAIREAMEELQLRRIRRFKRLVDIGALISLFQVNDADSSATLSWKNFSEAIFSGQVDGLTDGDKGEDENSIANETIRAVFDAADLDSDGYLDLDEFLQFLGLSPSTISAWRMRGPSAGVLWLNGIAPPGWMTESWIRQGEEMALRRQLREAKANTLRELRWSPSRHGVGGSGHFDSEISPVSGSPMVRAQELARKRGAVSRLQAIDNSSGVGQIDSQSLALGILPGSPTKMRALELARQRHGTDSPRSEDRGSPGRRSKLRRGDELSARVEEMRLTPRASRVQLIATAREYDDPSAGLNGCETMVLENPRHAGDSLTHDEQDDQHAQRSYDDQMRPLQLQPASIPQKIPPRLQREEELSEVATKVSKRSSQQGDYELYGGEASPGIDSLQSTKIREATLRAEQHQQKEVRRTIGQANLPSNY